MQILSTYDYVVLRADLLHFNLHAGDVGVVSEPRSPLHQQAIQVEFLPPDAQASIRVLVWPDQIDLARQLDWEPDRPRFAS